MYSDTKAAVWIGNKNIKGILFFYVSSETVQENSLKHDLDNCYSLANAVDGTRSY